VKPMDLHLHSSASDGLFPPQEVVRRAYGAGLAGLALTDHDTLSGLEEASREARRLGIRFVPGCEISIVHRDMDIHLLAYFVDCRNEGLITLLKNMEGLRRERVREMVRRLQRHGVALTEEEVWIQAGSSSSVGRMHVARALASAGHVERLEHAFSSLIGVDNAGYVPKQTPPAEEIVAAVWSAGAVPVLSHPGAYGVPDPERLVDGWDLGGIEAFHPNHSARDEERFLQWACRRGWIATGGSDWHGENRAQSYLGCRSVDAAVVDALQEKRRAG